MQSRLGSFLESTLNVASGFALSIVIWQVVGPRMGYHVTMHDNLIITTIFTAVSVARGYLWRRYFNSRLRKVLYQ